MHQLDFAVRADRGPVRETNQDVARMAPQLGLAVVADGLGGHEQGEVASRVAVETVLTVFERLGGLDPDPKETTRRLVSACEAANKTVRQQPTWSESARMGTTLVAVALGDGYAVIAHVGDSRCYLIRERIADCLTHDHSYAAELLRLGLAGAPELRAAERYQNILTRCIGAAEDVAVDALVLRLRTDDVLVLCSDGLWGGVGSDVIARIVGTATSAEDACTSLVGAAWQAGGLDNIGVAVVRVLPG